MALFKVIPTEDGYMKRNAALGGRFFCYGFMIRYDITGRTLGLNGKAARRRHSCGGYFTENAKTVVWSYFSPFFNSQLGKAGLFGVSGKNCVSRHSASRF